MAITVYNDPILPIWYTDNAGNKVNHTETNDYYKVINNKFLLSGIPDPNNQIVSITIGATPLYEAKATSTINMNNFKVDYNSGIVTVDSSYNGQTALVSTWKNRGALYFPASRVYDVNTGEIVNQEFIGKTLQDFIDSIIPYEYKGEYDPDTTYKANNQVYYEGSTYIALSSTTNNVPTNTTYWKLLSAGYNDTGIYNNSVQYYPRDVVEYEYALYVCKVKPTIGTLPTNTTYFDKLLSVENVQTLINNTKTVGMYSGSVQYYQNNIVTLNGSSFMAKQNTLGNAPPTLPSIENSYWMLISQKGEKGATLSPRGIYNPLETYLVDDIVYYNSISWQCIQESTGNTPVEGAYWTMFLDGSAVGDITTLKTTDKSSAVAGINEVYDGLEVLSNNFESHLKKSISCISVFEIDDFTVDNSLYQNSSNTSNSTVTMDTVNRKLTVAIGSVYTKSFKSHKIGTYGKNIMINTILEGSSDSPLIGVRMNEKDTIGAYVWVRTLSGNNMSLVKVNVDGITGTTVLTKAIDGTNTNDINVSVRTFNNMTECIMSQNGVIIGIGKYINSDLNNLIGISNGLGSNGATGVFKKYLKTAELSSYINIICIGDSNTVGSGLTTKSTYPALLQSRFFEKNVGVVNNGINGNRIVNAASRLTEDIYNYEVEEARNIVVLQIGTNNATDGMTANDIYNYTLNNIVLPVQSQGFEVWWSTIPTRDNNAEARIIIKEVNNLILSDTHADKIINYYSRTVDDSDTTIVGILQPDNLHLTERGQNILATLVANELNS